MEQSTPSYHNKTKSVLVRVIRIAAYLAMFFVIAAIFLLVKFIGWNGRPPVRVEASPHAIEVHVDTLGEYPTTIVRARLTDEHNRSTVWEIEVSSGVPQLHELAFKEGENAVALVQPEGGTYRVKYPLQDNYFRLERGVRYQLELWKDPSSAPAHVSIRIGE